MFNRKRLRELEALLTETQAELARNAALLHEERARHRAAIEKGNTAYTELRHAHDDLEAFMDAHGRVEAWQRGQVIVNLDEMIARKTERLESLTAEKNVLSAQLRPLRHESADLEAALYAYDNPANDSIALGTELRAVQQEVTSMVRGNTAVIGGDNLEIPTTKARRAKIAKDTARLALRSFNAEAENVIRQVTAANYESSASKLNRAADAIERLTQPMDVAISKRYLELRLREMHLTVRHLEAKNLERELERERKAELREQAQAERELEAERNRLEKERQHYLNVLATVETHGSEDEIAKLKAEIVAIEKGIHDVEERAANIRAGYVYVISNVGSFGKSMVKIGMTRRLDPMDRVRELSDASVPFNFDVHALFFSEDAVGVEAELHRRFSRVRTNLVNTRREFFNTSAAEVRAALEEIAGNLIEYRDEPEADQYQATLRQRATTA